MFPLPQHDYLRLLVAVVFVCAAGIVVWTLGNGRPLRDRRAPGAVVFVLVVIVVVVVVRARARDALLHFEEERGRARIVGQTGGELVAGGFLRHCATSARPPSVSRSMSSPANKRGVQGELEWEMPFARRAAPDHVVCSARRLGAGGSLVYHKPPSAGDYVKEGRTMSSLLSPSESLTFNTFLTSVDRTAGVEFQEISPELAQKIQIKTGKDALAKATMELLAKGGPVIGAPSSKAGSKGRSGTGNLGSSGLSPGTAGPNNRHESASRGSSRSHTSTDTSSSQRHGELHHSSGRSHTDAPSTRTRSSSSYTLPPLADHLNSLSQTTDAGVPTRGLLSHSTSAPATTTSKRLSSPDLDERAGASKRSRQSPPGSGATKTRRQTSSGAADAFAGTGAGAGKIPAPKPALLSATQKRQNHIQSEQKRRANIRRGYEALCNAVPDLRTAIAAEDGGGGSAADADSAGKGKRRRKKSEESSLDGRAGPRSENVVLTKTIEYIRALLTERQGYLARLEIARQSLAPGHHTLTVQPEYLDALGVPLWDREWNGGTGVMEGEDDDDEGADDDGGSDDDG